MINEISSLKEDSKKTILLYMFPGVIFSWIHIIGLIKFGKANVLLNQWHFEHIEVFYYFLIFLMIYGCGHLMNKIGLRVEVFFESLKWMNKYKGKEFDDTFEDYLKTHFEKEKEPVIIRYYSSFITAFKLETTLFCTLILMCISVILWNPYLRLLNYNHLIMIIIICLAITLYMTYEIKNAIANAHELRLVIIKSFKDSKQK
jgi:hypothetical protein